MRTTRSSHCCCLAAPPQWHPPGVVGATDCYRCRPCEIRVARCGADARTEAAEAARRPTRPVVPQHTPHNAQRAPPADRMQGRTRVRKHAASVRGNEAIRRVAPSPHFHGQSAECGSRRARSASEGQVRDEATPRQVNLSSAALCEVCGVMLPSEAHTARGAARVSASSPGTPRYRSGQIRPSA